MPADRTSSLNLPGSDEDSDGPSTPSSGRLTPEQFRRIVKLCEEREGLIEDLVEEGHSRSYVRKQLQDYAARVRTTTDYNSYQSWWFQRLKERRGPDAPPLKGALFKEMQKRCSVDYHSSPTKDADRQAARLAYRGNISACLDPRKDSMKQSRQANALIAKLRTTARELRELDEIQVLAAIFRPGQASATLLYGAETYEHLKVVFKGEEEAKSFLSKMAARVTAGTMDEHMALKHYAKWGIDLSRSGVAKHMAQFIAQQLQGPVLERYYKEAPSGVPWTSLFVTLRKVGRRFSMWPPEANGVLNALDGSPCDNHDVASGTMAAARWHLPECQAVLQAIHSGRWSLEKIGDDDDEDGD